MDHTRDVTTTDLICHLYSPPRIPCFITLQLHPILPAVTPLALLELWLAFSAVTTQHCYDAPPTNDKALHAPLASAGHRACLKNMNPKNTKKSLIHENADANKTCDFSDGDISRFRSCLSNTRDTYVDR